MIRTMLFVAALSLPVAGCGDDAPKDESNAATPGEPTQLEAPAEPGPLARKLQAKADESAGMIPPDVMKLFQKAAKELADTGLLAKAKNLDGQAVDFELKDASGLPVSLQTLRDQGPVVVAFYRGKWWPYCSIAFAALQQVLPEIESRGATLVGISPQSLDSTKSTQADWSLSFKVLSDPGNAVAKQYGLVFTLPEYIRPVYEKFGIDLKAVNADDSFELPVPATYVIDKAGKITWAHLNLDYRTRAEPADVLKALDALK